MGYETIEYAVEEGRAEIRFDRPDVLNAITDTLTREFNAAIEAAIADDDAYVVVLTGNGRGFCSGADLREMSGGGVGSEDKLASGQFLWTSFNACRLLWEAEKPSVAAINGPAVGGGFDFLLACDLRVMNEGTFVRDGHTRVGMVPTFASYMLPRLVGLSKAKEILLTGRDVPADEMDELGLLADVAPSGETLDVAREWANRVRDRPRRSVEATKALVGAHDSMDEAFNAGYERRWECVNDSERDEAIDAFLEDREPEFDREY